MDAPVALHEAMLYRKNADGTCDCFLCAHRCARIAPGRRGICRVRENHDGTLVSLVYGKLIAGHVDPIEKKPLYHFLPGTRSFSIATVGCNFRCDFCQNWQISQVTRAEEIPGEYTPPEDVVDAARRDRCPSISYTYTEPTIFFEYAWDCARLAKKAGIRNCFVTNGYATPEAVERMCEVIDAANVDLKAFNDEFYRERCKAHLAPVCETIRRMREGGMHVEVTTLLIPAYNDDPDELRRMAEFLASVSPDIPWHISRYHPAYQFNKAPITPAEIIDRAIDIGKAAGLRYIYSGNLADDSHSNTRCPRCSALLIERTGMAARVKGLKGSACANCGERVPIVLPS